MRLQRLYTTQGVRNFTHLLKHVMADTQLMSTGSKGGRELE